jgi:hypothetical protein
MHSSGSAREFAELFAAVLVKEPVEALAFLGAVSRVPALAAEL